MRSSFQGVGRSGLSNPAELPIERVCKYEPLVKTRVARVPESILVRADEVIR